MMGVQYKTQEVAAHCHGLVRVNVYKDAVKASSCPSLPGLKGLTAQLMPHYRLLHR